MNALARTAQAVRLHRAYGLAKPRRRLPRQVWPKLIELEYAKAMIALVDRTRAAFAPLLRELPALLERAHAERTRQDVGEARRAQDLIDVAKRHMEAAIDQSTIEGLARQFADRTQRYNRQQLQRQVVAGLGVDLTTNDKRLGAVVDHFVAQNASLIKSIPAQVTSQVEALAMNAFTSGTLHSTLAEQIDERFNVGESRARLIARDQVGKLYGQVNASRQQDLGVAKFVWRTAGDERVRPEHEELDGGTFAYDDPPSEGLPGEPVQCRCYAEPDFSEIVGGAQDDTEQESSGESSGDTTAGATDETVEAPPPAKNPKRVEAAKVAAAASVERRREIHSAVKSNLPSELHVAWEKEGHKFLRQESGRIKGVKDRINAASKISEAFMETYGSGGETTFGNEGDLYFKRAEIEARHAETWADEQERKYYEEMQRDAVARGDIDENGELTSKGHERATSEWHDVHTTNANDDDPPF